MASAKALRHSPVMFAIWTIARRDLLHFFSTPLAWLVLMVWLFILNGLFYGWTLAPAHGTPGVTVPFFVLSMQGAFVLMWFLAPAITMNSFSGERSAGTMQLLLTVPIREWQLVLGKFLASWCMLLTLVLATLVQPGALLFVSEPGGWQLCSGYIGLALYCAFLAGIGNWISLLVDSPVAAYVITFGILVVVNALFSRLAFDDAELASAIGSALGSYHRIQAFVEGDLRLGHVTWFLGGAGIWLLLTHSSLLARRVHG